MKRALIFPALLLLALGLVSRAAMAQNIRVVLNDREMWFDQPPAMIDGRLMVPLRGIFEALQADVLYNGATRTIKATRGPTIVELTLGSRAALLDGRTVYLDVPAGTLGGRTMVPLRFVSEALGAEVKWDGANRTVRIFDQGTTAGVPTPQPQPQPPTPTAGRRPTIDRVIHNGTRALQAGDSLEVVMTGDPGGEASFEILGVTASIPMREAGSGRYEARFVIPRGASVDQGVLTCRLVKDGSESITESARPVTIQASGQPPTPGSSNLTVTRMFPPQNSNIPDPRPAIGIELSGGQGNLNARFEVDQLDVTAQAEQRGNRVVWNPTFDLDPGAHSVDISVSDGSGAPVRTSWTFAVRPQPGGSGGGLQIRDPQNGAAVSGIFLVQGQATPGSVVTVQVGYQQTQPVFASKVLWGRGSADARGNFRIEMDAEDVAVGTPMSLTVTDGTFSQSSQLRRR